MNKFDKLYNKIITEWVNYIPSDERTQNALLKISEKYPSDKYTYLTGEDDWNAPKFFRLRELLSEFVVDKFHTGSSGYETNGIVIKQSDLLAVLEILRNAANDPELNGINKYKHIWQGEIIQWLFNTESNSFDPRVLYGTEYTDNNFKNVKWTIFDGKTC